MKNSVYHPKGKLVHFYFFQTRGGKVAVIRDHYQCDEDALTACAIAREMFGIAPRLLNLEFDVFFVTQADQMLHK
jgi:hypothetical protein